MVIMHCITVCAIVARTTIDRVCCTLHSALAGMLATSVAAASMAAQHHVSLSWHAFVTAPLLAYKHCSQEPKSHSYHIFTWAHSASVECAAHAAHANAGVARLHACGGTPYSVSCRRSPASCAVTVLTGVIIILL
jgi:hypothetical protein